MPSPEYIALALCLGLAGTLKAGVVSYRGAVATEPSRVAAFPVDGDVPPNLSNTVAPAFGGTLQTGVTLSPAAGRTIGTHSTFQSGSGRMALTKDSAWNFADGSGTVEAFVYQSASALYNPSYFSIRQDGGAGVRYSLHGDASGNNIYFWNGSAVGSWAVAPTMLNRLCHVAVVFDSGNATAYVNGVPLGSRAVPLGPGMAATAQIGASGPTNTEAWLGNIDEVALYADPLPAAAISAHYQAWLSNDSGSAPSISTQPSSLTRASGLSAAFTVTLASTSGASYRWQRNGVDIAGASSATYSITAVTPADSGAQFRCIVYNPYGGVVSQSATLIVADLTPPSLISVSAPYSANRVWLTFSEPVDLSAASFTIPGGVVTGAAPATNPNVIILTVSGLSAGSPYTLTASNVKDAAGNVTATANQNFIALPAAIPAPIALVRGAPEPMGPATRRGGMVISEIHYHPADRTDLKNLEFVEVCNTLPWTEDLSGFQLSGEINFTFPSGTTLTAGGYLVVAAVPADLQSAQGLTGVLGPYTGALNNNGGRLRLRDGMDAVVFEVNYNNSPPWPPAADGAGHSLVLARPSFGMDSPSAWDMSRESGGSPGAADPFPPDAYRPVILNEISATDAAGGDFVELYNYSTTPVDVSGCSLSDDRNAGKFVIPAGTIIPSAGWLVFTRTQLGFAIKTGGATLYFRAPGNNGLSGRVLDALRYGPQQNGTSYGRTPDGAADWSVLASATAGMANAAMATPAAVLSEIFYHPPPGSTQLPFVEIMNVSGASLDVGGWRLGGGVSYTIPASTTLANGAALSISAFSGSLSSGSGERLRLERPVPDPDGEPGEIIYPVVDEVTYGTGGRWGRDADGGGSSLEKRELLGDGRLATGWADSTENAEAAWITIQNTGLLDNGQPGTPANRLELLLLGDGEVLVDNVVLQQGTGANLVGNPGFENGMTNWSPNGTHLDSAVEAGTGEGGTAALHLRSAGRGDLAGNRVLNALISTAATGTTSPWTLRAQVKYLRGHPEILLRVHGGWLEATGNVYGNIVSGTPGTANSRNTAQIGPDISRVTHWPVLPQAGQSVTVFARVATRREIGSISLNYRLDPASARNSVLMLPRGAGLFSADLPSQAANATVAFTITATDIFGNDATFPANAPSGECLVRWGETQPAGNNLTSYRLWLTQATTVNWANRLKNSNALLDATFVCGDYRVIYNAGAMYSGSPFHTPGFSSPVGNACDYTVSVPADDRFLGITDMVWAGPGTFGSDGSQVREQSAWWIARKIRSPALHRRFINVMVNGQRRGSVMEDTQQPSGDYLAEYFPGDSKGPLYKAQDWIEYEDDGGTFGQVTRAVLARALSAGQHKVATYRYRWSTRSTESANDYASFTALADAFNAGTNAGDPRFFNALDPILDQDSWSRALAVQRIVGNWDTWGWSYGKNMYAYKPSTGPWALFAWDVDFGFGPDGSSNPAPDPATAGLFQNTSNYDANAPGDPLATKFRTQPSFRRAYWCALLDAANGPMVPSTFNARADLVTTALAANGVSINSTQLAQVKTYVAQRRNYIISQANAIYGSTTLALSGSSALTDADGIITLTGSAPPAIKTFRINGVGYTPQWTSETTWSLPLTLYAATNNLTVEGLGYARNVVGAIPVSIMVTGPPALPPVTINEWMANNTSLSGFADPADGNFDDWFELHNASAAAVNLSGYFLTDNAAVPAQFAIPSGTIIPAGGYLLVWADNDTAQNGLNANQLHTNFKLSSNGEQIALYTPDGALVNLVTFGPLTVSQSQGRYPDSSPDLVFPVPTPGQRNALGPQIVSFIGNGAGDCSFTFSTEPTHLYQIETSLDLLTWTPAGSALTATAFTTTVTLPRTADRRFWRARLLPP